MIVLSVASATAGIRLYCDYLGCMRAVVDTAGVLLQTMNFMDGCLPQINVLAKEQLVHSININPKN